MVLLSVVLILLALLAVAMLRAAASGSSPRWLADYQREMLGDEQYLAWASWSRTAIRSLGRILLAIVAFLLLIVVVSIIVGLAGALA